MSLLPRQAATSRLGGGLIQLHLTARPHTRAASYHCAQYALHGKIVLQSHVPLSRSHAFSAPDPLLLRLSTPSLSLSRTFSTTFRIGQQSQHQRPPQSSHDQTQSSQSGSEEAAAKRSTSKDEATSEEPQKEQAKDQTDGKQGEEAGDKGQKKEKEETPPPPPHGDKSPWQVFTDTLQSEFKASKEWNESTKALGSSVNQFTENESVKRARALYEQTSGAATSRVSTAVKTTGRAIGHGAAWTWETPVMKGVRKGATTVGKGVDAATKPIRETQAFKNVKDVIDDGSSSRYGGWVEKDERRKARELRELKEASSGQRKLEKMEEDPK